VLRDPARNDADLVDLVGRDWRAACGPRQSGLGALDQLGGARQRPPVHEPALDDPEGVEAVLHRVLREHQSRGGVRCAQHAVEPLQDPREPLAPAQQRRRALEVLAPRGLAHPLVDLLD